MSSKGARLPKRVFAQTNGEREKDAKDQDKRNLVLKPI